MGILSKLLMTILLMTGVPLAGASEFNQIIRDEGIVYEVYVGPKGHLHAGVGHRLPFGKGYHVGDWVTRKQVSKWFWDDYTEAQRVAEEFFPRAPLEVRDLLTNMAFNLGQGRLFSFVKLRDALERGEWFEAATEMQKSDWFDDVGNRSVRLVGRMFSFGCGEYGEVKRGSRCGIDSR